MRSISRKWLALAILIAISAAPFLVVAQEDPCLVRKIHIQVEDQLGNPITGLTVDRFEVSSEKDKIGIRKVEPAHPPANILLLMDMSGSRFNTFEFRSSLLLETELARQFPQSVQLASYSFTEEMYIDQSFTTDRALINDAIQRYAGMRWRGASAMYDALSKSIGQIRQSSLPTEGTGIILITDGEENDSRNNLKTTEAILSTSRIRVFTVGMISPDRSQSPSPAEDHKVHETLDRLSRDSGGISIWLWPKDPSKEFRTSQREYKIEADFNNIHGIASKLILEMASGYELELVLPGAISKPIKWELRVPRFDSMNSITVTARHPEMLYPCTIDSKK